MTTPENYEHIGVPSELADRLRDAFGLAQTPATLGDLAEQVRGQPDGLRLGDLCCDEPSRHEVRIAGRTQYTNCVMDALLLPVLTGETADVRSESPLGGVVRITVTPTRVETESRDAVISFGVARAERGAVQQTACPYINAFASRAAYERWASATSEAVTMALPIADAFAFARGLAERPAELSYARAGCC